MRLSSVKYRWVICVRFSVCLIFSLFVRNYLLQIKRNGPYSRGYHIGHRQQMSYPEPRVEMFGNEFRRAKTNSFNPSRLNMTAVWLSPTMLPVRNIPFAHHYRLRQGSWTNLENGLNQEEKPFSLATISTWHLPLCRHPYDVYLHTYTQKNKNTTRRRFCHSC